MNRDMLPVAIFLAALAFLIAVFIFVNHPASLFDVSDPAPENSRYVPQPPPPPPVPQVQTKIMNFMPGQSGSIINRDFRKVEVRSTFPVRVFSGPCHEEYTVDFTCDSNPGDVFITDRRLPPIFHAPEANEITITFTQF